ncbi:MAG: 50S ribosomal protein L29 [Actinomycetota bacterium]|jgi:large subunit ribosomal protein L29|nr:50S ribosomal protein L29 [Acidimicrobiaceae bacterium]MCH2620177.1 50S ribosomal protein L29 [Acidimicrobiales bacterium]MEC7898914.1 50S ribosomal protein L29 [Actinomycetota bacterium]|tara:strand:+ start:1395 stop:1634 length:240 start_codon:yes stop_codon:yes gene_type:complete
MAKKTLRDLADTDLLERFNETKEELFNLRFQLATGQLENHARVSQVKREVARVLTELREREISAAEDFSLNQDEELSDE